MSVELQNIIDTICAQGKMRFMEPATETEILSFEKKHGVTLPEQYKEWLLFSDGGELFAPAGVQLYGVSHRPMIDVNDDWCPDDKHLVIGYMSWGDPILSQKDSEVISIYNHDVGEIAEDETYENFYAFLESAKELSNIKLKEVAWRIGVYPPYGGIPCVKYVLSVHGKEFNVGSDYTSDYIADISEIIKKNISNVISQFLTYRRRKCDGEEMSSKNDYLEFIDELWVNMET